MHKLLQYGLFLGGICLAGRFLFVPLLPFLIAMTISLLLEPWIQQLRRRLRLRRRFVAGVTVTLLLAAVCSGVYLLFSKLIDQAFACLDLLPDALEQLPRLTDGVASRYAALYRACPVQVRLWLDGALSHLSSAGTTLLSGLSEEALAWLSGLVGQLPALGLFAATTVLATYFTALSYPEFSAFIRRQLPQHWRRSITAAAGTLRSTFWKWLRAESILCLLTFCLLLGGFLYLRLDYALLLAVVTALLDALPVLGAGLILVPWSIYHLVLGSAQRGLALLSLFAIILVVRSLAEPKIMAAQAGLPPLAALAAMYLGFRLLGIWGMLLFPIGLLFIKQLQDAGVIHLWK